MISLLSLVGVAHAQDPIDLGVLRNEEIKVVQNRLYPKDGASEMGGGVSVLPVEPYTVGFGVDLWYGQHLSETMAWTARLGGGWHAGNGHWGELTSPAYGVVPEAYGYVAGLMGGVEWAPVYAKMAWKDGRVWHHDLYVPLLVGGTVERIVEEELLEADGSPWSIAPTIGVGIGTRIFRVKGGAIKVEIRDDVLVQPRASGVWRPKQNIGLHIGYASLKASE